MKLSVGEVQLRVKCCSKEGPNRYDQIFEWRRGKEKKIESRDSYWIIGETGRGRSTWAWRFRRLGHEDFRLACVVTSSAECWQQLVGQLWEHEPKSKEKMERRNPINGALTTFYERPKGGERQKKNHWQTNSSKGSPSWRLVSWRSSHLSHFDFFLKINSAPTWQVGGYLSNMGQGLLFTVDNSSKPSVNLTGGPLSYKYEFHQMLLHFGMSDNVGSEHTIANKSFPAEVRHFSFISPSVFYGKGVTFLQS